MPRRCSLGGKLTYKIAGAHVPHLLAGEQIISPTTTAQDTQDGSSLFGEVGDLLRAVHAQEMHRLEQLEHPPQRRSLSRFASLWWRILAPVLARAPRNE